MPVVHGKISRAQYSQVANTIVRSDIFLPFLLIPEPSNNATLNSGTASVLVASPENVLMVRLNFYSRPCQQSHSDQGKHRERLRTERDVLRVEPTYCEVSHHAPKPSDFLVGLTYLAAQPIDLPFIIKAPDWLDLVM